MSSSLQKEHDLIVEAAQRLINDYWYEVRILSEATGDFSYLGVRLRERHLGISIEWYNSSFTKIIKANGKRQIIKNYIKKGKGDSYSLKKLKSHNKRRYYEIDLIDELEPKFAQLRKRSRALMKISMAVNQFQKLPALELN